MIRRRKSLLRNTKPLKRTPLARSQKPINRSPIKRKRRSNLTRPKLRLVGPAVKVYPDGREVCQETVAGAEEYARRRRVMWERQNRICPLCNQYIPEDELSFDHEAGRGMGGAHRDDRIELDGKPYNFASHKLCNAKRGTPGRRAA